MTITFTEGDLPDYLHKFFTCVCYRGQNNTFLALRKWMPQEELEKLKLTGIHFIQPIQITYNVVLTSTTYKLYVVETRTQLEEIINRVNKEDHKKSK